MRCPTCSTENPEKAKFCLNCGGKLVQVCGQCGAGLPAQARFCLECGTPVMGSAVLTPADGVQPVGDVLAEQLQRLAPKEYVERLLAARGKVSSERRLVTILFSDVKGSTAMAERLDPEEVMEIMNGAFGALIGPIYRHEGTLARLMGDAILAFFGAPMAHENDPERAVLAALEIIEGVQKYAGRLAAERGLQGFNVRVGINTGLVVVGEVGADLRVEYTAMGDAINLAARMEQNAPVGGILISHDTYRHVRGLFDVLAQEPLQVKGKAEPVQTYVVQRARPRAFRMATRGIEGVQTRTVGREAELVILQNAYFDAMQERQAGVWTVVGEAGVGKSRLLDEFVNWLGLQVETANFLMGRASVEMQAQSFSLWRDLFALRSDIRDTDLPGVALEKFRQGLGDLLLPEQADLVGQMVGFDFSASPAVRQLLGSKSFYELARTYLIQALRRLEQRGPLVILLEDIHWADSASLDLLDELAAECGTARLLVICLTRPALFERRPNWGEGRAAYRRLELRPLSQRSTRLLLAELLRRAESVPVELESIILKNAEGNPFYAEELVKMFLENGVILVE